MLSHSRSDGEFPIVKQGNNYVRRVEGINEILISFSVAIEFLICQIEFLFLQAL